MHNQHWDLSTNSGEPPTPRNLRSSPPTPTPKTTKGLNPWVQAFGMSAASGSDITLAVLT